MDTVQVLVALILLNLAGGHCVQDIEVLENDEGFCRVYRRVELVDTVERRGER